MAKKSFTIPQNVGRPHTTRQPSKPHVMSSAEVEALHRPKQPQRPDLTFDPPPSAPLDHERNQPSPTGKSSTMTNVNPADYPSSPAAPKAKAKSTSDTLPSEAEVAKLMPSLPAELRNNEVYRKRAYYYNEAARLGKTAAVGELTLINLAEKAVDGAIEGALLVSDEYTHATEMFHHFQNARVKAKPLTDDTIKNKARQLNWFIRLGAHYGADAKKFFNEMVDLHNNLAQDPATLKDMKYTAVYEDVNNLVRKQMMKVDEAATQPVPSHVPLMDEEEARTYVFKSTPGVETALDLLISAFKSLDKANEGRKENEKKGIPARAGLKAKEITDAMQIIQNFANDMSAEERQEFFKATSHKKPKKAKKSAQATASATSGSTSHVEEQEEVEVPEGFYLTAEGELREIPDGWYPDEGELKEIPQGYIYDPAEGGLVEEQ